MQTSQSQFDFEGALPKSFLPVTKRSRPRLNSNNELYVTWRGSTCLLRCVYDRFESQIGKQVPDDFIGDWKLNVARINQTAERI